MNSQATPHTLRAWWLAARPKTLSGALVSVVTATTLAYTSDTPHAAAPFLAVLCAAFAGLMQIASNFINDLIDFRRGRDGEDRLGPERACAQGWITSQAMQRGIAITLILAAAVGLCSLVLFAHASQYPFTQLALWLGLVGVSCGAGAFLYTTHLSRLALGDIMVLIFFGLIPVSGTYFLLTDHLTLPALLLGLSIGLVVDLLLVINNFRDRDNDARVQKRTLVVLLGESKTLGLYLLLGLTALLTLIGVCAALPATGKTAFMQFLPALAAFTFFPLHWRTWKALKRIRHGRALNALLGETSRNILVFAFAFCLGLLLLNIW